MCSHTHIHKYIYIYMYVYVYISINGVSHQFVPILSCKPETVGTADFARGRSYSDLSFARPMDIEPTFL